MLNDLDAVDWMAVSHAYGPAGDVPDLLSALADGSADALFDLFGNVWHQGTIYEATASAVHRRRVPQRRLGGRLRHAGEPVPPDVTERLETGRG